MKKLFLTLLSFIFAASMLCFAAACDSPSSIPGGYGNQNQSGGSSQSDTDPNSDDEEEKADLALALSFYGNIIGRIEFASDSAGETDVYTRSSVLAMQSALEGADISVEGKNSGEVNMINAFLEEALLLLKTVDEAVDERLQAAVESLDLSGVSYKTEYNDGGQIIAIDAEKSDEGAYPVGGKGVEKIIYDKASNTATFLCTADAENIKLITFIDTGVSEIFEQSFDDLTFISFTFEEQDDDGKTFERTIRIDYAEAPEGKISTYLAGALLAVGAGYGSVMAGIIENGNLTGLDSELISILKDATYSLVLGSAHDVTARIGFSNEDYSYNSEFTVKFRNYDGN